MHFWHMSQSHVVQRKKWLSSIFPWHMLNVPWSGLTICPLSLRYVLIILKMTSFSWNRLKNMAAIFATLNCQIGLLCVVVIGMAWWFPKKLDFIAGPAFYSPIRRVSLRLSTGCWSSLTKLLFNIWSYQAMFIFVEAIITFFNFLTFGVFCQFVSGTFVAAQNYSESWSTHILYPVVVHCLFKCVKWGSWSGIKTWCIVRAPRMSMCMYRSTARDTIIISKLVYSPHNFRIFIECRHSELMLKFVDIVVKMRHESIPIG